MNGFCYKFVFVSIKPLNNEYDYATSNYDSDMSNW